MMNLTNIPLKLRAPSTRGMIWIGIFLFGIAFWWSVFAGLWFRPLHIFAAVYLLLWLVDWFLNTYTITITKNDRNQGQKES